MPALRRLLSESGAVTAEFAMLLPTVVFVLGISLASIAAQVQRVQLVVQAADSARAVARGEHVAGIVLSHSGQLICVKVSAPSGFGFDFSEQACAREAGF